MNPSFDPEKYHSFYFSDLLYVLKSAKKRAFFWGFAAALLFLGSFCFSPPCYKVEALFNESNDKNRSAGSVLQNFFSMSADFFSKEEMQAITLMKSKQILRRVVEKLGLQARTDQNCISYYRSNWMDHVRAEMGLALEEKEAFEFSQISFLLERPENFFLSFHSLESFDLLNKNGEKIIQGTVGEKVLMDHFQFTLTSIPKNVCLEKKYSITFVPWLGVVEDLFRKISIFPEKGSTSFLKLILFHRDRHLAIHILNQIMQEYESYLKEENERVVGGQLAYLEKRQESLASQWEKTLDEQVSYLEKNLGTKGFVGLKNETKSFLSFQQKYLTRLSDLDFKIRFFREKGGGFFGKETDPFTQEIEALKRQRDPLDLSLNKRKVKDFLSQKSLAEPTLGQSQKRVAMVDGNSSSLQDSFGQEIEELCEKEKRYSHEREETIQWMEQHQKEEIHNKTAHLEELRKKKQETLFVLEELKKGESLPEGKIQCAELKRFLELWRVADAHGLKKEDLSAYLDHLYHLLSVEEKMTQENEFSSSAFAECEGLDLHGARKLFLGYSQDLDNSRLKKKEYDRIQEEMIDSHFEISSLSSLFEDSVTKELIQKASKLSFCLCDEKNYTPKERDRFREELNVQKTFLAQHIQEVAQREVLKSFMLEEKLLSLQTIVLDRLNQEISILEQQKKEFVGKKIEDTQAEKELLMARLDVLKEDMSDLPQKWKKEKELKFRMDMGLKMIGALTESIESKMMLLNLQRAGSKPIDLAFASPNPKNYHLMIFLVVFMVLGVFSAYVGALFQGVFRGFPVSQKRLEDLGFFVAGQISHFCGEVHSSELPLEDLEALRKMILFLEEKDRSQKSCSLISIFSNQCPNYAQHLADLLTLKGNKVLLIDTSFTPPQKKVGFLHYITDQIDTCPIEHGKTFDILYSGEDNFHGMEALGSKKFREMITCLKEKYDDILLLNKSSLKKMEPQILLPLTDFLLLTYEKETLLELKPFTDWADSDNKSRLVLIGIKSGD